MVVNSCSTPNKKQNNNVPEPQKKDIHNGGEIQDNVNALRIVLLHKFDVFSPGANLQSQLLVFITIWALRVSRPDAF